MIRVTYEVEPPEAAETIALVESVGGADGPEHVRGRVASIEDGQAVIEFPEANWGGDLTLLVSSLLAGEWCDSAAFKRCRLVAAEWPAGTFRGPAFDAREGVLVGAIVKPSLGLSPKEAAETAAALARGGADLVKDDELLGNPDWCPLEERVRAVVASMPGEAVYAPNVTGPVDALLKRAERVVELGAKAVMVSAFAQGLDALRLLRDAELGVPIFAHRVGSALWVRNGEIGVAAAVVASLTRLCGADYVQIGSFMGSVFDSDDDVRAQLRSCQEPIEPGLNRAVAVLGGGVGPGNAAEQVRRAGATSGVMVLLGSAAYLHPGGPEEAVRATVEALR